MTNHGILRAALLLAVLTPCSARGASDAELQLSETFSERELRLNWSEDPHRLLYSPAAKQAVMIRRYLYDREQELSVDLYYPPGVRGTEIPGFGAPVVIFPMGFTRQRISEWGVAGPLNNPYQSDWAALFASVGAVAVFYEANTVDSDFRNLLGFLSDHQSDLGLDLSRVAIWATSGLGKFAGEAMSYPELARGLRAVMFVNADPRPRVLPDGDVRYYLIYAPDGSRWHLMCAALERRVRVQGRSVVVDTRPPYKGFGFSDARPQTTDIIVDALTWMQTTLGATGVRGSDDAPPGG